MMQKVVVHSCAALVQHPSDELIARLFQVGDSDRAMSLFQRKYKTNLPAVRKSLLAWGCDRCAVEDVLQDAWEQFLRQLRLGKYRYLPESSLFRWFIGIVRNVFLKHCRAARTCSALLTSCDPQAFQWEDKPDSSPSEAAASEELHVALKTCVSRQTERNLRLVIGYYVEDLSYEQLAAELDYSTAAVAKQRSFIVRIGMKKDIQRQLSA